MPLTTEIPRPLTLRGGRAAGRRRGGGRRLAGAGDVRRPVAIAIALVLAGSLSAAAQDPPLLCFGNEPSWSLSLEKPGIARLTIPDEPVADFQGTDTRLEHLRERVWRGRPAGGTGSEIVAFLRQGDCSDGMSDVTHPFVARVSLPDGRFLAGCCRITAPAGGAPNAAAVTIEGTAWRLTQLQGQDAKAIAGQPAGGVVVRFEAGRLQGFGGCNQFVGSYTISLDHVTLGPLAGTMMACEPPVMAVETAFKEAFSGTLYFRVSEGRLAFASTSDAKPKLVFEVAPEPRLEGVAWEVTGFNNGRHAVVGPLVGTTLTVSFQDGAIVGNAGCNRFRAAYTRDGNRLSVGPATATRMMCEGKGVMEQEREFLAAVESATTWTVERDMLDMHRADGERVLTASPSGK